MITKTTDFFNRLIDNVPRAWNSICLQSGLTLGDRDIDCPEYFKTANPEHEERILPENLPCYTVEWQNRTRQDNFSQRIHREGDLSIKIFALNNDDDLSITRDYLQNALDFFMQMLSGQVYRRIIGGVAQVNTLNQIDVTIPGNPNISGKRMTTRIILS